MSRYIDADALIRYGKRGTLVYWEDIEEAPSIDIVRCGECRHYYNKDPQQIPTANIMCSHMHPDDFCSYGQKERASDGRRKTENR